MPRRWVPSQECSRRVSAACLKNLIVWDRMKTNEPVLTQQLSGEDLKKIVLTALEVGRYPVHGQGAGSCVREVTAAPEAVFGQDRRDGFEWRGWITGRRREAP